MEIILNGKKEELESEISLIDFLTAKDLEPSKLVVEYNQKIIQQTEWNNIILTNGDELEILRFVGGG